MNRLCLDCAVVINVGQGSRCVTCQAGFEQRNQAKKNAELGGSGGAWETIRKRVYERQEGRCARCGSELNGRYEVDHIRPRSDFRRLGLPVDNSAANLQALDPACHKVLTAERRAMAKVAS